MTLLVRPPETIHRTDGGWFSARWHFSFDDYVDPEQMGFGPLRVFNDDRLVAGAVWPLHPHRDIEGITWVVEGTFEHEDSMGNGGTLLPGSLQRATLGSGMYHSERNGSKTEPMRFLQFWILPDTPGLAPSIEQRQYSRDDRRGRLLQVVGNDGGDTVSVHQDAAVWVAALAPDDAVEHRFEAGRAGYLYLIDGGSRMDDGTLVTGDAAKLFGPEDLRLIATAETELILIEVPDAYTPVGVWR